MLPNARSGRSPLAARTGCSPSAPPARKPRRLYSRSRRVVIATASMCLPTCATSCNASLTNRSRRRRNRANGCPIAGNRRRSQPLHDTTRSPSLTIRSTRRCPLSHTTACVHRTDTIYPSISLMSRLIPFSRRMASTIRIQGSEYSPFGIRLLLSIL